MLSRDDLHEYQSRAVDFVLERKRCLLLLDLGLGKTVSTLTAMSDLLDGCAVGRVLVIAPLRVANSVWKQEVARWSHLSHLRVQICTGPEKDRRAALHRSADVYVINRENVPWLVELYGSKWPFDAVVVDESSSFKNASTKRFRALRKVLPDTRYMVLLTGTPSPNGLHDLWSQCYLVDYGMSLGRTLTSFRQRFFDHDYFGHSYTLRDGMAAKIEGLIAPYSLSMRAEDYLDMPERIDVDHPVEMGARALAQYRDFEKQMFVELGDEEIEAVNAAVLAGKLLQFANGAMYTDEAGNWAKVHDAKIEALKEIVEDNEGENLLIAYNFKSDLERLTAAFPDAVVLDKDDKTIQAWNAGQIKMLLAHPASAGHGLNLQHGGSVIVWFGLSWSLEHYQQFNARLHRQGQGKPVRIIHLVASGTIDERVKDVLTMKGAVQSDLLEALKAS